MFGYVNGYWVPVSSGGRPLSDFVDIINPNGQGSQFIPREWVPADWQPGMSIQQNPDGTYRSAAFKPNAVSPYDYQDYGSTPPQTPPPQTQPGGLLTPGGSEGLPTSGPVTQPPTTTTGGGLPISQPGSTTSPGGLPVSMPSTSGPVSMPNLPPIGAGTARDEIERLRMAGLLDNLQLSGPTNPVRAPDYGNGPGVPMTHDPGQQALFEWVRNNYFGTWDPRQTRGGSNPYYNAPTSGEASLLPPIQGPIITGPGLL
jgi:hypothetical protein